MKCPDCNKFASYDEPEAEINSSEISDGEVSVEGTVTLRSACCNYDLKEWNFTLTLSVDTKHKHPKGSVRELEVECDEVNASDYYDSPGRPMRYRRHIYVVEADAKVKCSCGFEVGVQLRDEQGASGFDELT